MGYYQRKAGEGLAAGIGVLLVVALIAVGPYVAGKAIAGPVLGWVFEILYLAGGVTLIARSMRKSQQRSAALAAHRTAMALTNQVWFDPGVRSYRHSTCTIRHRSAGAAQRCRSRV